ncbi:MAG: DEAD/DEAH box helicase [Candidatus Aenigmatarchaeota archaeon]
MNIEELSKFDIEEAFIKKFAEEKIFTLYPPQADIVRKKLLDKGNLILSVPTAGGKTLIATLAMIKKLSKERCKVIYLVPLVALAYEKFEYYKKFFEGKYKVAISVSDYDSADPWLADYDIIIMTNEKCDSLIRHGANWIKDVKLIVADEIHLINDPSRGPTLEILLALLRKIIPQAQILGLSATIRNVNELANWLNASFYMSDFRPVKLFEGIAYNSKIQFYGRKGYELSNLEIDAGIVQNTLQMNKQCLFFVSTRKGAEALAEKLSKLVKSYLKRSEERELTKISDAILNVLENPTQQCKRLANCVKRGAAFHHAGLLGAQKRIVEENFRNGLIKVIVATPTLALGVNLPAFRVIIRDAKRYYPGIGTIYIPVLEYKQMIGRAGRPQYDEFGEAILISKTEEDAKDLTNHFILGEPEEITSKLMLEPILRMHTLALIASELVKSKKSLNEFFSKTFFAFQYGNISLIEDKLEEILQRLEEWEFIKKDKEKLTATKLGKRVSELYIDPLTANYFVECLKNAVNKETESFSYLQTICNTLEFKPLLSVRTGEFSEIENILAMKEKVFLQKIPEEWDLDFDEFFKSIKTALMLEDWINEASEDKILTKYGVAPGELRGRLEVADWLIYCLQELALLLGFKEILKDIRKLRIRLMYGVKEELIPLVRLEQVGRIRARKLFDAGLKTMNDLRKIPIDILSKIVGPTIAKIIKDQLEGKKAKEFREKQSTLEKFGV